MKTVILSLFFGIFCTFVKPVDLNVIKERVSLGDVQNIVDINLVEDDLVECLFIALESEHDSYNGNLKFTEEVLSPDIISNNSRKRLLKEGDELRLSVIANLLKMGDLSKAVIDLMEEKISNSPRLREYFVKEAHSFIDILKSKVGGQN